MSISKSIIASFREAGGRFLERVDGRTSKSFDERDDDGKIR